MLYWQIEQRATHLLFKKTLLCRGLVRKDALFDFMLFLFGKEFSMKENQYKDTDGDIRVGKIEYRSEKQKILSAPERQPLWKGTFV